MGPGGNFIADNTSSETAAGHSNDKRWDTVLSSFKNSAWNTFWIISKFYFVNFYMYFLFEHACASEPPELMSVMISLCWSKSFRDTFFVRNRPEGNLKFKSDKSGVSGSRFLDDDLENIIPLFFDGVSFPVLVLPWAPSLLLPGWGSIVWGGSPFVDFALSSFSGASPFAPRSSIRIMFQTSGSNLASVEGFYHHINFFPFSAMN